MSLEHFKVHLAEIVKQREEREEEKKKDANKFQELLTAFEEEIKVLGECGNPSVIEELLDSLFCEEFSLQRGPSPSSTPPSRILNISYFCVHLFQEGKSVSYSIEVSPER